MEKKVLRDMRRLIYRPRFEDREVVETQSMIYTHEFFYRESDLEPVEPDPAPEPPVEEKEEEEEEEVADAGD